MVSYYLKCYLKCYTVHGIRVASVWPWQTGLTVLVCSKIISGVGQDKPAYQEEGKISSKNKGRFKVSREQSYTKEKRTRFSLVLVCAEMDEIGQATVCSTNTKAPRHSGVYVN